LLRKTRRELGLSQDEAAKRAGYTRQHYGRLESGVCLLPMDGVWAVSGALLIEEALLMRAALTDRMPDGWEAVQT
jgi:transcriptional regulator with XRE-family HTH domain